MSTAENSIRADLEAAVKQHAEPEVIETAAPADVVDTSKVETASEVQARERDERGRFAAKGAGVERAAEPAAQPVAEQGKLDTERRDSAAPVQPAGVEQPLAGKEAAPASLAPPNGWSTEAKAKWHELSPEVMAAVQKREQDIAKFTSTRDEHASFGKEIYQTVQPYLATIRAEGGTPRGAIESLLNTAYVLRTGSAEQKRQLILQTAQQFGVDLGTPAAKPNGQPPTNAGSPEIAALQREVAELRGALTQRETAAHNQLQSEVQTEIEAFAADPKHPHYSEVKAHMAALLREGAAKNLQDAYDQAVWARPETRATLQAQQRAEEEQKRRTDAKAKADAAKRKNVSITGGPGNTAGAAAPGGRSIREELLSAVAESSGSV